MVAESEKIRLNLKVPLSTRVANKVHRAFIYTMVGFCGLTFLNFVSGAHYKFRQYRKNKEQKLLADEATSPAVEPTHK